ncbi:MAG: glycogen/starch synthase [Pseudomonadales bacterium]|nr:glycogen/starch synthase [Pseudomonadales bacterium]NRA16521.1 glycogen/starch synthase [Oceanospirillaceae bacterium]
MHILMVAAENDAIAGAKVGGVADVVRDVPQALAKQGHRIDVIIPDYGNYSKQMYSTEIGCFDVPFAGVLESVKLVEVTVALSHRKNNQQQRGEVRQLLMCHPLFSSGGLGRVYLDDPSDRPFSSDATKYALFCAAICEAIHLQFLAQPDVLHLHDWHSALIPVLSQYIERYQSLKNCRNVYTVHNLSMQGTRPFKDFESSLEAWFPALSYDGQVICDPRFPHCFNPMRAAINLCDKIHLVSPSYVAEVLLSSDSERGFFGGEGLEQDLNNAQRQKRLVGILNGCNYHPGRVRQVSFLSFLLQAKIELQQWMAKSLQLKSVHYLASERINTLLQQQQFAGPLVTSVGRLTDQKVMLLRQESGDTTVLGQLLRKLDKVDGFMVLIGSGDKTIELEFMQMMSQRDNFIFLNGYGKQIGEDLYQIGDLFLMPSSYEPCGISQMLALKAGQPCLVNNVGGLKDTIKHLENGFCFSGNSIKQQIRNLTETFEQALCLYIEAPDKWQQLRAQAKSSRFKWQHSIERYITELYQ